MASDKDDAAQRRREHWREVLRRWQASGLSQAAFCRQRKIPIWRFTWWKKRLRDGSPAAGGLFVPIHVAPSAASSADFELTLRGGRVLRFGVDVEPTKLAKIVAAIESVASPAGEGRPC
jgi:hypothetical protein